MATVTVNGITFDSDGDEFAGTAYVEGVIALAAALIADAGRAMATTSLSTYELGTGGGTVTMAEAVPFVAGAFFTLADQAAPGTNYAHCQVAARSGVSLTFTEIAVAGSGEKSAWNINLSGSQGAALLQGSATGALDMAGYRITVDRVTHEEGSEWKASATSSPAAVSGEQSAIVMRGGATRWIKIDGDTQQPVILPASGYTSAMRVIVEQGGAGGFDFALTDTGSPLDSFVWVGTELDFTSLTAGQKAYLSAWVEEDGQAFVAHYKTVG